MDENDGDDDDDDDGEWISSIIKWKWKCVEWKSSHEQISGFTWIIMWIILKPI